MNAASIGFAIFLIFWAIAAVLLVRLVLRNFNGFHSTSSGFTDGSGGDGGQDCGGDTGGGDCGGGDGDGGD